MRNMFEELQLRIDSVNMHRTVTELLEPRAHVYLYEVDQHGDQLNLSNRKIGVIGTDFIEVEGEGLVDRKNIRSIFPINF